VKSGIKAGALVKLGSEILGGGGGGKDDFAQGGGSNHSEIASALSAMSKSIGQTVSK
jgi:alanyl-tRNA synthetase